MIPESEMPLPLTALRELPREWPEELLPSIRRELAASRRKLVILDDDPTGTQTIRDLPVLTSWTVEQLVEELKGPHPAFFLLTNSRSLSEQGARDLARELGHHLRQAMELTAVEASVISRGDSTLRGHFPAEVDELAIALGRSHLPRLVVPFFEEGGRYTLGDVHYVREGERLLPAAATPFAGDPAFGYRNSHLKKWVEEKSRGKIGADEVATISLEDLRHGGPSVVARLLQALPDGSTCIVNGASSRDMEVLSLALLHASRRGRDFLCRSAASLVRSRLGQKPGKLLEGREIAGEKPGGGLIVVGSHVEKSTRQLAALLATGKILPVELPVGDLLDQTRRAQVVSHCAAMVSEFLAVGRDCVLFTSRRLHAGRDGGDSLRIAAIVSASLITVVKAITVPPRYLVAKGGITSSDLATKGLQVARAMVIGQILPGVPVWRLGPETRYSGMGYVVFPGNVGDDDALVRLHATLTTPENTP